MSKKILLSLFLFGFVLTVPLAVYGANFQAGESLLVDSSSARAGNLYAAASSVNVSAPTKGDLLLAGGSVIVSGPVEEDMIAAGGSLFISGKVSGDLRAVGGNIDISSSVGGELVVAGGQIIVASDSVVSKNADIFGGSINYNGTVLGDLSVKGDSVYINGPVRGDLLVKAGEVKLGPSALIDGNFEYSAKEEAVLEDGALVKGATNFEQIEYRKGDKRSGGGIITFSILLKTLSVILGALILFFALRRGVNAIVGETSASFWKEALRGLIILIVTPIAAIILFATGIGIPIGFFDLFLYASLLVLSSFVSVLLFGKLALKYIWKDGRELNWWIIVLSAIVLGIIAVIPVVGWMITFVIFLASLGGVSNYLYKKLME